MRVSVLSPSFLVCTVLMCASRAAAGGFEYAGSGPEALGRGGATTARADSPMVLSDNPAGLAELRGTQFLLSLNLALLHACMDPAGYYGWGAYGGGVPTVLRDAKGNSLNLALGNPTKAATPGSAENAFYNGAYDTVCLNQNIQPIPEIAWAMRLSERLGIGFGLIFPAQQPGGSWGGPNGVIQGADGALRSAATRYMLLSESPLGLFPTLGVGYRLFKQLRIGAAVEWGIIAVNTATTAAQTGGTTPANDVVTRLKAQDWFVPGATVSAHFVPIDALDVVLAFRWQDDIQTHGTLHVTTGEFSPTLRPYSNAEKVTKLTQKMPWKLRAGVRYADRFAPRVAGTGRGEADPSSPEVLHDPLQDERWDLELDVEYQLNGRNNAQVLDYAPAQKIYLAPRDPSQMLIAQDFPTTAFPNTVIQKHWVNQISARLGGTINVLPGVAGLSAGIHYENRGQDPDYMQVDFWPVSRLGLHGGVVFRLAKGIDLMFSYAHIFQETIIVAAPEQQSAELISQCYLGTAMDATQCRAPKGQVATIDKTVGSASDRLGTGTQVLTEKSQGTPDGTARLAQNLTRLVPSQPPYIINAGRYRSDFDIVAAGVNVHF